MYITEKEKVVKNYKQTIKIFDGEIEDTWCENEPAECCVEDYSDCPDFPKRIMAVIRDFEKFVNICYTSVAEPISRFFQPEIPATVQCTPSLYGEESRIGDITTLCYNGFDNGTYRLHKTWEGEFPIEPGVRYAWYMLSNSVPIGIAGRISATCSRHTNRSDCDAPELDVDITRSGFTKGAHPGQFSCTPYFASDYTPETLIQADCVCRPTPDACDVIPILANDPGDLENPYICSPCLPPIPSCQWTGWAAPAKCEVNVPCNIEWMSVPLPSGIPEAQEGWPLFAQNIVFQRFYAAVVDAWSHRNWPLDPNTDPSPCSLGNAACYAGIYLYPDNDWITLHDTPGVAVGPDSRIGYYPVDIFTPRSFIQICLKLKCVETNEGDSYTKKLVIAGVSFRSIVEGGWSATFSHFYKTTDVSPDLLFPGDPCPTIEIFETWNNWSVQGAPSGYVCNNFFTLGPNAPGFLGPCPMLDVDNPDPDFSDLYKKVICSFGGSYVGTIEFIGEP
jgi:hypothetical protein